MPIIVKDYTWKQTDSVVLIYVPLKGVHPSKVNIFTTENYIKAHFPPFLFEVFLWAAVDEAESQCTIAEEQAVFQLCKKEAGAWESLHLELGKAEMVQLRQKAIERAQQVAKERSKEKAVRKDQLQKLSVREQIQLDSEVRARIEELKKRATDDALADLQLWKETAVPHRTVASSSHHPAGGAWSKSERKIESKTPSNIFELTESGCVPVPLPRRSGNIEVNFTVREFPTPCRESQAEEEQAWLKQQAEARRQVGFVEEDLRPEERDPVWLKDKGDSFFRAGNYLGAVSAYSHAIKLGSKMPEIYSNRAAAHFALNNLHKTLNDCTKALELLVPAVPLNALQRARCHARRGSALCRLGLPERGLVDLRTALALKPGDQQLREDVERTQALVDGLPSDSDSDEYVH
ncbi:dynein axonemal assembly factor 4 isoform X2 [Bacillus rossius redtenbacheri]|uniref:dynein axonemal assembly factor 4 isoform X2 n=1 Tax=Bacillus rossius redtenbacheri TaxID=93214 RepID=UPI002FDE6EE1